MRFTFLFLFFLPAILFAQTFRKKYKGAIGPYPITITLVSKNGNLTGTYYYESFDDPISIRGFVSGKSIRFRGFDLKGNIIDEFVGQVNKYDIQGIWIGEGMQKRYNFSLREVYVPPPPMARIFTLERVVLGLIGVLLLTAAGLYLYVRRTKRTPRWILRAQLKYKRRFAPHRIGYEFERYMTDRVDPVKYRLIEWKNQNGTKFRLSTYSPGLVFEQKNAIGGQRFGIACRFFEKVQGDTISIGKGQDSSEKDKAIFVALGVGGKPSAPESVYLVPIDKFKENKISLKDIVAFKIQGSTIEYDARDNTLMHRQDL